jgi:hypothetical protein
LLPSQSAWSKAAPSSIGYRSAKRQGVKNGASVELRVSGSSGSTWTTNEWEPTYRPASRSYKLQPADYESVRITSRPPRQNWPDRRPLISTPLFIQSGTAPLFIPSSTATVFILPVPATSGGPFKDCHELSMWRAWSHTGGPTGEWRQ